SRTMNPTDTFPSTCRSSRLNSKAKTSAMHSKSAPISMPFPAHRSVSPAPAGRSATARAESLVSFSVQPEARSDSRRICARHGSGVDPGQWLAFCRRGPGHSELDTGPQGSGAGDGALRGLRDSCDGELLPKKRGAEVRHHGRIDRLSGFHAERADHGCEHLRAHALESARFPAQPRLVSVCDLYSGDDDPVGPPVLRTHLRIRFVDSASRPHRSR